MISKLIIFMQFKVQCLAAVMCENSLLILVLTLVFTTQNVKQHVAQLVYKQVLQPITKFASMCQTMFHSLNVLRN